VSAVLRRLTYRPAAGLLQAIAIVVLLLVIAIVGNRDVATSPSVDIAWAKQLGSDTLEFEPGNRVNLGYTDSRLLFEIRYHNSPSIHDHWISLKPTFHDSVVVEHYSRTGQLVARTTKGDREIASESTALDLEQLLFNVPPEAARSVITITSVGNLRALVRVGDAQEFFRSTFIQGALQILVMAVILLGAVWCLLYAVTSSSGLMAWASGYLTFWVILLVGMSNFLVVYRPEWGLISHHLVSFGALGSTLFGAMTHAKLLEHLTRAGWLFRTLQIVAGFSGLWIMLYLLGFERLALSLNIWLVSIVPVLMIAGIAVAKPRSRLLAVFWYRIRVLYGGLFLVVSVTSISGLGVGNQLSMTFFHALITVLILAYVLLSLHNLEKRFLLRSQIRNRTLLQAKALLKEQLNDQRSLVSMMSHEIKTPLTTLKLLTRKLANRPAVDSQIAHIDHVVDQSQMLELLVSGSRKYEWLDLNLLIISEVDNLSHRLTDKPAVEFKTRGSTQLKCDPFVVRTIVRNVVENAFKYALTPPHIAVSLIGQEGRVVLRVKNNTDFSETADASMIFEKYWRADSVRGLRGTGLGMWIVKRLCRSHNYGIKAHTRAGQFVVDVSFRDA
jgi:signal transduction histidine kinase